MNYKTVFLGVIEEIKGKLERCILRGEACITISRVPGTVTTAGCTWQTEASRSKRERWKLSKDKQGVAVSPMQVRAAVIHITGEAEPGTDGFSFHPYIR